MGALRHPWRHDRIHAGFLGGAGWGIRGRPRSSGWCLPGLPAGRYAKRARALCYTRVPSRHEVARATICPSAAAKVLVR